MKKKLLIFFLIFFALPIIANADIGPYCDNKINQAVLKNIDNLKIKNITVKVDEYRKWIRNTISILIGNFRFIPEKFKNKI